MLYALPVFVLERGFPQQPLVNRQALRGAALLGQEGGLALGGEEDAERALYVYPVVVPRERVRRNVSTLKAGPG